MKRVGISKDVDKINELAHLIRELGYENKPLKHHYGISLKIIAKKERNEFTLFYVDVSGPFSSPGIMLTFDYSPKMKKEIPRIVKKLYEFFSKD